jgi:hypothetical protein
MIFPGRAAKSEANEPRVRKQWHRRRAMASSR